MIGCFSSFGLIPGATRYKILVPDFWLFGHWHRTIYNYTVIKWMIDRWWSCFAWSHSCCSYTLSLLQCTQASNTQCSSMAIFDVLTIIFLLFGSWSCLLVTAVCPKYSDRPNFYTMFADLWTHAFHCNWVNCTLYKIPSVHWQMLLQHRLRGAWRKEYQRSISGWEITGL